MQQMNERSTQQIDAPLATAISELLRTIEASPSMQTSLIGLSGPFRQVHSKEDPEAHITSSQDVAPSKPFATCQDHLHVQTTRKSNPCPPTCSCSCHVLGETFVPHNLRHLFGRGTIKTRGRSLDIELCNERSCRRSTSRHVQVKYILPRWIAIRMLSILYTSSPTHSPEFLIRIPRFVPFQSQGFRAVGEGDLERLKCLVASGECTPDDVDEWGDPLLFVCEKC